MGVAFAAVSGAIQRSRETVAGLSPTTAVRRVLILDETIVDSVAVPRFRTFLIVGLAGLAAVLALLGVYGVLAFAVTQRTREIGVRIALGAHPRTVVMGVVGSGLKLTAAGVAIGLLIAWGGAGVLRQFLFEIAPTDPPTYLGIVLAVLVLGSVAAYVPARRAAAVDPMRVLNSD